MAARASRRCIPSLASVFALAVSLGCATTAAPTVGRAGGITWPVPEGWKQETLTFPLEFAPDLPHRGVEEIRFAPGFFDPKAPGYWSYAFAWILEDSAAIDEAVLSDELVRYFRGLSLAVGGRKYELEPSRFKARVEQEESGGVEVRAYRGQIETYDPFTTGAPITLQVRIRAWNCPAGKRVIAFAASPQAEGTPIWDALHRCLDSLRCGG